MNPIVSIFTRHSDIEPSANLPINSILAAIKKPRERVAGLIAQIRSEPDKAKRRELKGQLPAICFGAQLKTRSGKATSTEKIEAESGIVCLDFDGIEDLDAARARLEGQKHVLSVFVSPSGNGLKVLVPILGGFQTHWRALAHHMESEYGLKADEARKDVCGLCYASHDPATWIAADPSAVELFAGVMEEPLPNRITAPEMAGHQPRDGEVLADFLDEREAELALSKLNPDCEYQEWIAIGQAIHCQFSGSGQGLALYDSWSSRGGKYTGIEDVIKHYQSFHGSGITFRTILKSALAAGYTMPKRKTSTAAMSVPPIQPRTHVSELRKFIAKEVDGSYALISWPWPELTRLSKSLLPGSITMLCGSAGASKSWFNLQCLKYWAEINVSAECLMIEQGVGWHSNRLLAMLERRTDFLDESITKADPTEKLAATDKHEHTTAQVERMIHAAPNVTMVACAKWIEERCAAGVRVLIVDPITLACNGSTPKWQADSEIMRRAGAACEASGTSLVLVAHPSKVQGPSKGPPQMDDMAGGAAYNRAASSILWLTGADGFENVNHKGKTENMNIHRKITVLKSRNGIGTGKTVGFQFNDLNFEELGMIEPSESKNGDKKKIECAVAKEAKAMQNARRATKYSSTPQNSEDAYLNQETAK